MCRATFTLLLTSYLVVAAGLHAQAAPQLSQDEEQTARDRGYALELFEDGKALEALPWFERLAASLPKDALVQERFGECLLGKAGTLTDPVQRTAMRVRARQQLLRAQELGGDGDLLKVMLASLPEDGSQPDFSTNPEIDRLMKQAEAAFAANHWDEAKKYYLQALIIDPNYYEALLFMGDVYFRKGDAVAAGEWFSRAIQLDPDRETAYRYWGDALLKQHKLAEAREKFIAAFICDPYDQHTAMGVNNYLRVTKQKVTWYKFQSAGSFTATDKGGTINIDPSSLGKKDGSSAWIVYPMERIQWKNEKFAKAHPNEKVYRHSLKEESAALSLVASTAKELSTGKNREKLAPDLAALVNLNQAGLLDAYILMNAADQGIAQDYAQYRKEHRDVLYKYMSEVVVPAAPTEN
jgi:tetratricopeptide (TPR) repeat protein